MTENNVRIFYHCLISLVLVVFIVAGTIFLRHSYISNLSEIENTALTMAGFAEAGIPKSHLYKLNYNDSDLEIAEYK